MSSDLVTVDNLDVQRINYVVSPDASGDWNYYEPPNDPNVWDAGVDVASSSGLSAIFEFTGSQVSVYGRVEPPQNGDQPPLSLYSVGSTKLQAFIPDAVSEPVDNVAFFNSSIMPYGHYTLIINVTRASVDTPFYLDYIRYNITDPSSTPVSTASSSTTSGPAQTSKGSSSAGESSSTPIGPIVGGVVAGVAAIAAGIIAFLCYRMRRRRPRVPLSPLDPATPSAERITPYIVPSHANSQSRFSDGPSAAPYSPQMRQLGSAYSLGTSTGEPSGKGYLSGKAARAGGSGPPAQPPRIGSGSVYATSSSGGADASSVAGGGTHRSHTSPSPLSSVHDLPNFVPRGAGHMKGARSETDALLPSGSASGSGLDVGAGTHAQQDSGMRFEPGITPSDVAPVLPPGAAPIRSTATMSEVARADIPPAYTPD